MVKATRIASLLSSALMLAVALFLSVPASASSNPASKTTTKTATKANPATSKKSDNSIKKASTRTRHHALASAEDLSGTISAVDSSGKEVTLMGSNGVPYDFDLSRRTRVELSNQKIGMNQLANESHKQATIHFLPTSRGNLAESIQITS